MAVESYDRNGMTIVLGERRIRLSHEDLDRIERNKCVETMSDLELLKTVEVMGIVNELKTDPKPLI